ncbi:SUMF1/EgtB/PvdO family nonheme iron enzyme [Dongia sp.]|jgi:formylglycine-generating enzyme required for sulfatase activity|uniref:SUMF1/EgtB/PvdO family nonheme iron enzyme n=1 Tax=Dongia sp. TaxID=1977262 RepID=UPI0034A38A7E
MHRLALLIGILFALSTASAQAEPRLALVIGNAKYGAEMGKLPNPANDASLMADTLTRLGFKVTKLVDADQKKMKRAISNFGSALIEAGPDAAGLFFYAGHGVQIDGENYLIPLAAKIEKEADAELEAVPANWILKQMEFAGNRINIIILDACRNNPLARGMRSADRGLARMDAPKGSFIAYSTAPGETAADGDTKNSPYTKALAKAMLEPGVAIEETFRNARIEVLNETAEKQVPWESSSLTGAFFFQTGSASPTASAPAPEAPATETAAIVEAPVEASKSLPSGMKAGSVIKDCPTCPELVAVAPGSFTMGAQNGEDGASDAEYPQTTITIAPFAIGRYEVTKGEFAAFVKAAGYRPSKSCWGQTSGGKWDFIQGNDWQNPSFDQQDNEPVVCVSAADADAYVKWLSKVSGLRYRLPSEAEWEYAARAGSAGLYYWGDDSDDFCSNGNIADEAAGRHFDGWRTIDCDDQNVFTAPVGSFRPNAFGLYDVLGNVGEWVGDCWNDDLEGIGTNGKARRSGNCNSQVVRGTGWDSVIGQARLAVRTSVDTSKAYLFDGFRVARGF